MLRLAILRQADSSQVLSCLHSSESEPRLPTSSPLGESPRETARLHGLVVDRRQRLCQLILFRAF